MTGCCGSLPQLSVYAFEVEVARAALWQRETGKENQRDSDKQLDAAILRLDEPLKNGLRRKVAAIGDGPSREGESSQQDNPPKTRTERAFYRRPCHPIIIRKYAVWVGIHGYIHPGGCGRRRTQQTAARSSDGAGRRA